MTTTTRMPWTPGPWRVEPQRVWHNAQRIYAERGNVEIARVATDGQRNDSLVNSANAQLIALAPEMADSLADAEAAIGENLVWITDCADLLVRQKDPEALRRLKQLNDAWLSLVKITSRLPKGE